MLLFIRLFFISHIGSFRCGAEGRRKDKPAKAEALAFYPANYMCNSHPLLATSPPLHKVVTVKSD